MARRSTLVPVGILLLSVVPASQASVAEASIVTGKPSSIRFVNTARPNGISPQGPSVIFCGLKTDYPHGSTHVSGTINVVARVTCDSPVTSLGVTVRLLRSEVSKGDHYEYNAGSASVSSNKAISCLGNSPGNFRGDSNAAITPPPGYTPTYQVLYHSSPTVPVACGSPTAKQ